MSYPSKPVFSSGGGGSSVSVPLSIDSVGATTITVRRGTPASGTLQTWDLEYRETGAGAWTEWATGLTGETETVTGRTPETQYEFRATGYVLLETTAQASAETGEAPPGVTQWRLYNAGGMNIKGTTLSADRYTYTWRVTNLDTEPMSEMILEFASIYGNSANIASLAWSVGGSGYNPGPAGWAFATFDSGETFLDWNGTGSIDNPELRSTLPIPLPGNLPSGGSVVFRLVAEPGLYTYAGSSDAEQVAWPTFGKRATGDFGSTPELLATNPASWSVADYGTTWYGIRWKRATPTPMLIIHGDSVFTGIYPPTAANQASGYNYCMMLNAATEDWHIASLGHGGTTIANALARTPEILAKHDYLTHMIFPAWSGNGSPVNIADNARIQAEILAAEALVLAAGKQFWVATLKPHGGTITTADEIAAYWAQVAWADARYGARHLNLSQEPTLSADGGLTLLNSEDNVHFNVTGQQAQATALKPRIDAALAV